MMTRRFWICTVVAILALVAVAFALLPRPPGDTQARFKLLRPGMTQKEAELLLGGSPRNDVKNLAIVWIPRGNGKRVSAEIRPGNRAFGFFPDSAAEKGHQAVWITSTGLIAVSFGPDGRLQQKYFSTVHETAPPTVIDWLASRPRMIRLSLGF